MLIPSNIAPLLGNCHMVAVLVATNHSEGGVMESTRFQTRLNPRILKIGYLLALGLSLGHTALCALRLLVGRTAVTTDSVMLGVSLPPIRLPIETLRMTLVILVVAAAVGFLLRRRVSAVLLHWLPFARSWLPGLGACLLTISLLTAGLGAFMVAASRGLVDWQDVHYWIVNVGSIRVDLLVLGAISGLGTAVLILTLDSRQAPVHKKKNRLLQSGLFAALALSGFCLLLLLARATDVPLLRVGGAIGALTAALLFTYQFQHGGAVALGGIDEDESDEVVHDGDPSNQRRIPTGKQMSTRDADGLTKNLGTLLLVGFVLVVGWRAINRLSWVPPNCNDMSVYAAGSSQVLKGQVLYRDVWCHRAPMVYLIGATSLWLGDGNFAALRDGERILALVSTCLVAAIAWTIFRSRLLAALTAVMFGSMFYEVNLLYYVRGFVPEELGMPFLLAAILLSIRANRSEGPKAYLWHVFGMSVAVAFAVLTKEPFLFSAAPWVLYATLPLLRQPSWWSRWLGGVALGGMLPLLILVLWFASQGALVDWRDAFLHNFTYIKGQKSLIERLGENAASYYVAIVNPYPILFSVSAVVGLASLVSRSFQKSVGFFPLFVALQLVGDYLATAMSGKYFIHYYIQPVVGLILMAVSGLVFLVYQCQTLGICPTRQQDSPRSVTLSAVRIALLAAFVLLVFRHQVCGIAYPFARYHDLDPLAHYVKQNSTADDTIWALSALESSVYIESGRVSAVSLFYFWHDRETNTQFILTPRMRRSIRRQLDRSPPRFLVLSPEGMKTIGLLDLQEWMTSHYQRVEPRWSTFRYSEPFRRAKMGPPTEDYMATRELWTRVDTHATYEHQNQSDQHPAPASSRFWQSMRSGHVVTDILPERHHLHRLIPAPEARRHENSTSTTTSIRTT